MIVLDTDVLTIVQDTEDTNYRVLANRLDAAGDDIYTTIISFEEQVRGWMARIAGAKSHERQVIAYWRLQRLLDDYRSRPLLPFKDAAAYQFETLRRQKIRIGTMDLRIAAIALVNDAILISRNLVDFQKVPGLRVEDWTAA